MGDHRLATKIRYKLLKLLYDLAINDDGLIGNGYYVRQAISNDGALLRLLMASLGQTNLDDVGHNEIRTCVLNILFRVYQIS